MLSTCPSVLTSLANKSNMITNINQTKSSFSEKRIPISSVAFTSNFIKYYIGIIKLFLCDHL